MNQFLARMSFAEGQGPQVFDEHRLALRGVLIRHLVMPGLVEETRQILRWIADEVGAHTYVNLMDHTLRPAGSEVAITLKSTDASRRKNMKPLWRLLFAVGLRRPDHRAPQGYRSAYY